ncbi:hypothetical protein E2562_006515 [Oryza meyeriana var. granulata]|uniref:Uncharacterized protein n=1 Tax=Oryza meyeriana var. granulata TaxID=110450 RepID=A0A6G1CPA0_9ORYZ|nr:hypothetical protein E2562_006515 [Oryza meyeriana var. granulata]
MDKGEDGGAEVNAASAVARAAMSSTFWSRRHHHPSAWRSRRRRREHCPAEVRAAVAEAEDGGTEVDAATTRVVVSSTSWTHC